MMKQETKLLTKQMDQLGDEQLLHGRGIRRARVRP